MSEQTAVAQSRFGIDKDRRDATHSGRKGPAARKARTLTEQTYRAVLPNSTHRAFARPDRPRLSGAGRDPDPPTAPTGRADEPMSLTAHVAGRCIEIDRIFFGLPFAAVIPLAIVQDHATRFRPDIDRAGNLATTGPGNATAYP